ncbi:DUF2970 domain-containing protein [Candidatus Thioglobus sp.]|nr:DUF2970 domain-containing protein [Candidatus Thioglobus sp.]|tara:strand:+ start:1262 stop:1453 length:192 start_codon:yes stop_codon:yes gene_type:complete
MKSLMQVFRAVASAMIGVGKKKSLAQDFEATEKTGPLPYIIVGLFMTALFIGSLILAVRLILP